MACLTPILIDDPRNLWLAGLPVKMFVPCGHCIGCLRKRQNDWSIRVAEQLKLRASNCFVTLTYRDSNVPIGIDSESGDTRLTLKKSDYQKFLKVLRSDLTRKGFDSPSFFVCGEYGSRTFRPHYHIVVCGANTDMIRHALDYWVDRYGYVLSKDIGLSQTDRQSVGMYVGKYSSKGVFIEKSPLMVDFIEKPFCVASHFLGRKYIEERIEYFSLLHESHRYRDFDEWVEDFSANFKYHNGNFAYSMPTYYKDYFFNHLPYDLLESLDKKAHFNPMDQKINLSFYGTTKNGVESRKAVVVPSFRDSVAVSLYHLSCAQSCEKYQLPSGEWNTEKELADNAATLSSQYTFLESESRKLDSFYYKSKL